MNIEDALIEIKRRTGSDRVCIECGILPDDFEVELQLYKGERFYPFMIDWNQDLPSITKHVIETVDKLENITKLNQKEKSVN